MTTALLVILVLLSIAILCIGLGIRADIKEQKEEPGCYNPIYENRDHISKSFGSCHENCGNCPWSGENNISKHP